MSHRKKGNCLTREEAEEMLQHMVPGTTIEDMLDGEGQSSDEEWKYDVVAGKGGIQQVVGASNHHNQQAAQTSMRKMQPTQHSTLPTVMNRVRVDEYYDASAFGGGGSKMNQRVLNDLRAATMTNKYTTQQSNKDVDRSERATVENVMDPRTRMILYKLVNTGILTEVNGCVSTGKEANVYYALSGDGTAVAIKIFKTSILVFKDREQYVAGDFRFQRYCKSNPRKMVRTWAEKEARNLSRLQQGGVLVPGLRLLRQHVLVMDFIGEDGWPAPRLKEVSFPNTTALDRCYLDLCTTMRTMFIRCRLVHGDLSEFNLLFFRGRVVVIDVSQSVEYDHPRSMDFLRRDIVNVNAFFRTKGHRHLLTLQELFFFITTPDAGERWQDSRGPLNNEAMLAYLQATRENRPANVDFSSEQAKIDEQVFLNIEVPRSLGGVSDVKQTNRELKGFVDNMLAASAEEADAEPAERPPGIARHKREFLEDEEADEEDDEEDEEFEELEEVEKETVAEAPVLANMTKEERKENRKAVKAARRDKRESKNVSKNEKKRSTKKGKKSK